MFVHTFRLTAVIVAVGAFAACGSSGSSSSPVAPTPKVSAPSEPAATPAPGVVSGATISGTVVGGVSAARFATTGAGLTVAVTGTSLSTAVDPSGAFTLQRVPPGHVQLQFSGPTADARLDLDDVAEHEEIHLTVRVAGTEVEVEDHERQTPDNKVEIEGRVTAVGSGALTVVDKVVSVPAGTTIKHGGTAATLSDIHVGDRVHVKATKSGTTLTATLIELQTSNGNPAPSGPKPGDDHGKPGDDSGKSGGDKPGDDKGKGNDKDKPKDDAKVELSGALSAKSGTCPAITFSVSGKAVSTNASTEFRGATCGALANGDQVEVKATKQANGTLLAIGVQKKTK